jgi:hypothetical protein
VEALRRAVRDGIAAGEHDGGGCAGSVGDSRSGVGAEPRREASAIE